MAHTNRKLEMDDAQSLTTRSTRESIELMVELLRGENPSPTHVDALLVELAEGIDHCIATHQVEGIYEDAIQRAPWLTADGERLKQQLAAMAQSLQALRMLASRGGGLGESLAGRFEEFAELYAEHEAAEQDFLQAAFPGPDWALQS